jgi:hypothetical protein
MQVSQVGALLAVGTAGGTALTMERAASDILSNSSMQQMPRSDSTSAPLSSTISLVSCVSGREATCHADAMDLRGDTGLKHADQTRCLISKM